MVASSRSIRLKILGVHVIVTHCFLFCCWYCFTIIRVPYVYDCKHHKYIKPLEHANFRTRPLKRNNKMAVENQLPLWNQEAAVTGEDRWTRVKSRLLQRLHASKDAIVQTSFENWKERQIYTSILAQDPEQKGNLLCENDNKNNINYSNIWQGAAAILSQYFSTTRSFKLIAN